MEMTGLDPDTNAVIEIATIVTDSELNVVATGPQLVIKQDQSWFKKMDKWNQDHHSKSGLWDAVLKSDVTLQEAEAQTLKFVKKYVKERESPVCGNSVWQDRRFLRRYMPKFDNYMHYRIVDVSSFKETILRWYPNAERFPEKASNHRALDDILESIAELKFYRAGFFK